MPINLTIALTPTIDQTTSRDHRHERGLRRDLYVVTTRVLPYFNKDFLHRVVGLGLAVCHPTRQGPHQPAEAVDALTDRARFAPCHPLKNNVIHVPAWLPSPAGRARSPT